MSIANTTASCPSTTCVDEKTAAVKPDHTPFFGAYKMSHDIQALPRNTCLIRHLL